ncbi:MULTISPECIES: 2'-5' RNA ligase family protein [Prauserella salsuginis group]|uniref:2'-5' RNA ligase family protein n=1 Tax=Prauserella salsuginis TaxID=387889 RepID=A0ABW6G031_9PSEU|nr:MULTISPECIES: 2'-5' RNA ligase family protein [Prauserella salsuginis group]MCR3721184.1 2'-5' RNA ligase superfamily protein [Prauserella flava]MCR3734735.1 2'-5' RNA ligase superfamily protein [Prauserella salsuginis]
MGTSYSSTFPTRPPTDPDDPASVARNDQAAFEQIDQMLCHWDRPHRRSYHWMVTLDMQSHAVELSQRCQAVLPEDGLDLIPPESLHLTVRRFGYVDQVPAGTLDAAVTTVSEHCRAARPFDLRLLPLAGSPGALRFSVAPWSPLLSLHRAVSAASGYDDVDPLTQYRPHVGIAYSNQVQPPGPFIAAAHKARSLPSTAITITELRLVELYRTNHQYRWHVLERLPIAATS